jgi:hypothetical protein
MKKGFEKFGFFALLLIILFVFPSLEAEEMDNGMCAEASVTDISPTSIDIGEEFTVGVQIENCGEQMPEFISFELLQPPEDIEIKEPLVISISKLYYGNSERFIVYHMRAKDNASPGAHFIKTRLSYGSSGLTLSKNYNLTFDIIGSKVKTNPVLPEEGDTVELTIRVENSGTGTAKSVKVYTDHPFQGLKQSFIGTLESEEDGSAILTFVVDKKGEYTFPVTIFYNDDFGEGEVKTDVSISVLKKPSNIFGIAIMLIIFAAIGWGIFYFFRVKNSKDKIIHQLLKGEKK